MGKQPPSGDELKRQVALCGVAMRFGFDSDEMEEKLRRVGLSLDSCTPEQAIKALRDQGYTAWDRNSWNPWP